MARNDVSKIIEQLTADRDYWKSRVDEGLVKKLVTERDYYKEVAEATKLTLKAIGRPQFNVLYQKVYDLERQSPVDAIVALRTSRQAVHDDIVGKLEQARIAAADILL